MSRERPGRLLRLIEPLQGPFTAIDDHLQLGGRREGGVQTALAPAAMIVLMAITFRCNGVAVFLRNSYGNR